MRRLDHNSIQVLVDTIDEKAEKFLRIVLVRSIVLGVQGADGSLTMVTTWKYKTTENPTKLTLKSIGVR